MDLTTWLIDKSALIRLATSPDAAGWAARIERGLVRITTVTRLETGYSARSGPEMRAGFQRPPLSSMPETGRRTPAEPGHPAPTGTRVRRRTGSGSPPGSCAVPQAVDPRPGSCRCEPGTP